MRLNAFTGSPTSTFQPAISSPAELYAFLKAELERRCDENPNYSLRAFSRALKIECSVLSKILSGKRRITPHTASLICRGFGLAPSVQEAILKSYQVRKRPAIFSYDEQPVSTMSTIPYDSFKLIASWYHFAIVELTAVKGFKEDPHWIAKKLNISQMEAKLALERLARMGLIVKDKAGKWQRGGNHTSVGSIDTSVALREAQKAYLKLAATAIDELPVLERDFSTITVASTFERLAEAKELIKNFRRKLCKFLEVEKDADFVAQICIQMFPCGTINRSLK